MYLISTNSGLYKSDTRQKINQWCKLYNLPGLPGRGKLILYPALQPFIIFIDGRHLRRLKLPDISIYVGLWAPLENAPKIDPDKIAKLLNRVSTAKPEKGSRMVKFEDRQHHKFIRKNKSGSTENIKAK